jgi:hypothetical protein
LAAALRAAKSHGPAVLFGGWAADAADRSQVTPRVWPEGSN